MPKKLKILIRVMALVLLGALVVRPLSVTLQKSGFTPFQKALSAAHQTLTAENSPLRPIVRENVQASGLTPSFVKMGIPASSENGFSLVDLPLNTPPQGFAILRI